MTVEEKIEQKRVEMKQERDKAGKYKKSHDPFLLWGEYPHGWQMIKDFILCLMLLNALVGRLEQIDLSRVMAEAPEIAQVARIQPAEAATGIQEVKTAEIAKSEAISYIVAKVYRLESSGGKNDSCKDSGKVNGYGYGQNDQTWYCYESYEQVTRVVTDWFDRNLDQYTLPQALCRYNTGIPSDDCEYYQKYQML